jgi:hypothetical protein
MHYRPVCYYKTRIKYLYGTVQNAQLYLIGNLSKSSGQKCTKFFFFGGGGIREIAIHPSVAAKGRTTILT